MRGLAENYNLDFVYNGKIIIMMTMMNNEKKRKLVALYKEFIISFHVAKVKKKTD